ncbi:MAG: hypothetical protein IJ328_00890 [Muribaculaceae bacterium]|nr:hypothetical protein [Muribaculaceae bacterium]
MRKILLSIAVLISSAASAQLLNVGSTEKVNLPEGVTAVQSAMSHDGSFAVINGNGGLVKVDLATGATVQIAKNASLQGIEISEDGSTVVFKQSSYQNRLRYTALKSVNLSNGKEVTLVAPSRNLQGFNVVGNRVNAINKGKISTKALNATATAASAPVASINRGALNVTVNGVTRNISPQGTEGQSYLWPSVSPDGTKVLYYLAGRGAYVCNLDGSNPVSLGVIRAPQWYNNEVVVGMLDRDNGEIVTSSKIVASKIDGSVHQDLTQASSMAMYPAVSGKGNKLSYVTPNGQLFVININQ